jgi:exosome complex RNA-binding protein Csl4
MAEKYIDQKEAIQVIQDISNHYHKTYVSNARAETAEWCLKKLKDIPAADVVEVVRGKWIFDRLVSTSGGTYGVRRCSRCEAYYQDVGYGYNYCPNCGAKMDGDGE